MFFQKNHRESGVYPKFTKQEIETLEETSKILLECFSKSNKLKIKYDKWYDPYDLFSMAAANLKTIIRHCKYKKSLFELAEDQYDDSEFETEKEEW